MPSVVDWVDEALYWPSSANDPQGVHLRQRRTCADIGADDLVLSKARQAGALALEQDGTRRAPVWRERQARLVGAERRIGGDDIPQEALK